MTHLRIVFVRTGTKYGIEYVACLAAAIKRYMPGFINYQTYCITDQPDRVHGVQNVLFKDYLLNRLDDKFNRSNIVLLNGWWAKLFIFNRAVMSNEPILYFDLDTVIGGDLGPLIEVCFLMNRFLILENFTKLAGHTNWPCNYGSAMMYIPGGWGNFVWQSFIKEDFVKNIEENPKGDQQYIERVCPGAAYFQNVLPPNYVIGRRQFKERRPKETAIFVFAGQHKPHNTNLKWLKKLWVGDE